MPLRYQSGEGIQKGDRVTYARAAGEIELVADPLTPTPETDWYIQEFGRGVMFLEWGEPGTRKYGRVFLTAPEDDEDLDFVSRLDQR
jgi:hypothetical protein